MKRFHWQLFALSTLSFSVSTENFGFTVSTPFFFLKNLFLNSKMHVNHSLVAVIQQKFYSVAVRRAKQLFFFCLRKGKLPKRQAWYVISKGADVFTGIMSTTLLRSFPLKECSPSVGLFVFELTLFIIKILQFSNSFVRV